MIETGSGENNILRQVYKIQIEDTKHQAHGYFGGIGIGNVGNNFLKNPLVVSAQKKLDGSSQQVKTFYDRMRSYTTAK